MTAFLALLPLALALVGLVAAEWIAARHGPAWGVLASFATLAAILATLWPAVSRAEPQGSPHAPASVCPAITLAPATSKPAHGPRQPHAAPSAGQTLLLPATVKAEVGPGVML